MVILMNEEVKLTNRSPKLKKDFMRRLKIVEGQVRGVEKMLEDDRYCGDVLIQISAINKSLKSLASEILRNHMATCVVKDIKSDNLDTIDEVIDLIRRLD